LGLPLDEVLLSPGTGYFWRAQFIDADGRDWRWCQPVFFTVNPAPFADANSNNIPDDQEVTAATDLDGNGVDDAAQTNMARVTALDGSPLGLTTGAGEQSIDALCVTDPDSLPDDPAKPEDIPLGLVSFRVNVEEAGDTATVTIFFSEPLAAGMVWYKYDAVNGWQDFSARAQFADDMTSVTLTLTDGGIGDADGVANGVIVDPSGAAGEVAPGSSSGYESSAGSSCFITTAGRLSGIMK
ncbi:MAG: choice-of-anchor U domain-containing protein, partial [Desulfosudaceae bacterium]